MLVLLQVLTGCRASSLWVTGVRFYGYKHTSQAAVTWTPVTRSPKWWKPNAQIYFPDKLYYNSCFVLPTFLCHRQACLENKNCISSQTLRLRHLVLFHKQEDIKNFHGKIVKQHASWTQFSKTAKSNYLGYERQRKKQHRTTNAAECSPAECPQAIESVTFSL